MSAGYRAILPGVCSRGVLSAGSAIRLGTSTHSGSSCSSSPSLAVCTAKGKSPPSLEAPFKGPCRLCNPHAGMQSSAKGICTLGLEAVGSRKCTRCIPCSTQAHAVCSEPQARLLGYQ